MKALCYKISLIFILLTGCTQRHYVTVNPYVPVAPHSYDEPKSIGLAVINARSSNNIAQRIGPDLFFLARNSQSGQSQT